MENNRWGRGFQDFAKRGPAPTHSPYFKWNSPKADSVLQVRIETEIGAEIISRLSGPIF